MSAHKTSFLMNVEDFSLLQPRLVWCYEGEVFATDRFKVASERHLHAWWILKGHVILRRGAKTWKAGPGEWFMGGPQPRHQQFSKEARILSINFKLEWPSGDSLMEDAVVVAGSSFPELARTARPLVRFVSNHFPGVRIHLWKKPTDLISFFELQHLFSRWILAYLKTMQASGILPSRMSGMDSRVLSALRLLIRHPWPAPFREKALAKEVGLSSGHLDRLFVQQLGCTPREYLQKQRLESSRALLSDSGTAIKKIAYDLGFSSPGHFSCWFRNASGKTPLQFRLLHDS